MNPRARRIALVGAGSMGRNHARVVSADQRAQLTVVADPSATGREVAEHYGATWVPSIDDLPPVDGVIVAASTEHHYAIATQLIGAGLPLLIEKPVCPSLAQTVEILDASRSHDVPLMCGLLERYNPAMMVAMRMIRDPLYVRAERHSPYAPRIKTGVAWDLLVHDVDLIVQIFGAREPESIAVERGRFHPLSEPEAEDVVEATITFPGGAIASASASRLGQRKVRTMVVHTLDRMVEVDLLRRGVTAYRHTTIEGDEAGGAGFRQATEMEVPEIAGKEPLAAQFERFLGLVNGKVDPAAERDSILPAHAVVDRAIAPAGSR